MELLLDVDPQLDAGHTSIVLSQAALFLGHDCKAQSIMAEPTGSRKFLVIAA